MNIILFGAGKVGKKLLSLPLQTNCHIDFICDNDSDYWGKNLGGYMITSPENIKTSSFDYVIIASTKYTADIRQQLLKLGVPASKIVWPHGWNEMESYWGKLDRFFAVEKKQVVPFQKGPAVIYRQYKGETSKSFERRRKEGFFELYCQGEGLDIGYGSDPLLPTCSGWDSRNGDAQYLRGVEDESFDFVYSSHCLEHMDDVRVALQNWFRVVKRGGYLILAVPDRDLYEKKNTLPSRWNSDHKHMFLLGKKEMPDTLDIVEEIRESLDGYDSRYVKRCDEGHTIDDPFVHSDGEYQIEAVVRKF